MINIRSGINRHLTLPPWNRNINIMQNIQFLSANKVFKGRLRKLKQLGYDLSHTCKEIITDEEIEKIYKDYFMPNMHHNPRALQHKVYLELSFQMARRGKQNLHKLKKDSFEIKTNPEGREYIQMNFNEATKKNQGDKSRSNLHDGERNIIVAQPQSEWCPVKSFKLYLSKLNPKCDAFFQTPNPYCNNPKYDKWYKNCPVGEGKIAQFMKEISALTNLPKLYTNHKLRGTTATVMESKFGLSKTVHVTQHKSYESLRAYLAKPTIKEREEYSSALFNYGQQDTSNDPPVAPVKSPQPAKTKKLSLTRKCRSTATSTVSVPPKSPTIENQEMPQTPPHPIPQLSMATPTPPSSQDSQSTIIYTPPPSAKKALVLAEKKSPNFIEIVPKVAENAPKVDNQISNLLQNVYKMAPAMFTGANFQGCTFNINLPK